MTQPTTAQAGRQNFGRATAELEPAPLEVL
jgi:hypothetical protein